MSRLALAALVVALPLVATAKPRKQKRPPKAPPAAEPLAAEPAPPLPPAPAPAPVPEPAPEPASGSGFEIDAAVEIEIVAPAKPAKRWYVRAGVAHIAPLASSREMELADIDGAASLAVQNGPVAGSGADVTSATTPAVSIGFRLTDRLAIETVLGLPFTVKFRATGTLATESLAPMALGIPTGVPPLGEELGEAKAAPPVVTAVYTLLSGGRVRPYVGGGAALLIAYGEKVTNPMLIEVSEPEMSVAPAPGLVFQSGIEARLHPRIYARIDVKFIAFLLARGEVRHIQVRTPELPLFDTVEVGTAKMSVWVNPLIIQAGIGTDF